MDMEIIFLNIWADVGEHGEIKAILLKYFEFMMFYSDGEYDVEGFIIYFVILITKKYLGKYVL